MSENQTTLDYLFVYPDYSMWSYEENICEAILRQYGEISENPFLVENGLSLGTISEIPDYNLETLPFFQTVNNQKSGENITPRGCQFEKTEVPEGTRKSARYLGHGLHEYTGKFYPQLVSAIFSLLDLEPGDTVMDPFCGSGTTLYQGRLESLNTVGIDINPFSVYLSRTKVSTLDVDLYDLKEFSFSRKTFTNEEYSLPEPEYLNKWFESPVINQVRGIHSQISNVQNNQVRQLLFITLSDLLRTVSHQDEDQIRVLRDNKIPEEVDVYKKFKNRLNKNINRVENTQQFKKKFDLNHETVVEQADATKMAEETSLPDVDHMVCSPPYATGLPYVDTYRLSLFTLGLLEKNDRRDLERQVIGNREIRKQEKRDLEEEFLDNYDSLSLPANVKELIKRIYDLNIEADVGFRRKNKTALLYKYFRDMRDVLEQGHKMLPDGGNFVLVVGRNTTKAGDDKEVVEIPTDDFLYDIGEMVGFEKANIIEKSLNSTAVGEVHNKNAIQEEKILFLEK